MDSEPKTTNNIIKGTFSCESIFDRICLIHYGIPSFNKQYTVTKKRKVSGEFAFRFNGRIKISLDSVADPDSHHSEQLDPDPLKEKSQGIRIPVKSWILIRILLQHVLQSEKSREAGEALNAAMEAHPGAVKAHNRAEWAHSGASHEEPDPDPLQIREPDSDRHQSDAAPHHGTT
jgi:hypothetical protein